jgi:hypothetical protein
MNRTRGILIPNGVAGASSLWRKQTRESKPLPIDTDSSGRHVHELTGIPMSHLWMSAQCGIHTSMGDMVEDASVRAAHTQLGGMNTIGCLEKCHNILTLAGSRCVCSLHCSISNNPKAKHKNVPQATIWQSGGRSKINKRRISDISLVRIHQHCTSTLSIVEFPISVYEANDAVERGTLSL